MQPDLTDIWVFWPDSAKWNNVLVSLWSILLVEKYFDANSCVEPDQLMQDRRGMIKDIIFKLSEYGFYMSNVVVKFDTN